MPPKLLSLRDEHCAFPGLPRSRPNTWPGAQDQDTRQGERKPNADLFVVRNLGIVHRVLQELEMNSEVPPPFPGDSEDAMPVGPVLAHELDDDRASHDHARGPVRAELASRGQF